MELRQYSRKSHAQFISRTLTYFKSEPELCVGQKYYNSNYGLTCRTWVSLEFHEIPFD
jgi:hypothetical protein